MWWLSIAWAECPADPAAAIRERVRELEAAYDAVEEDRFVEAYAALHQQSTCLREPLDRTTAAAWHRGRALGEFFEREEIASVRSWAAVKALDPVWRPPEGWIVEGTPLHRAWVLATDTGVQLDLERAPRGGWWVDGQPGNQVPRDRAFVLQGFDAAGEQVHGGYHFSIAEVPLLDFEALDATVRQRRQRRMRVAGTALGGALAVGSLSALAAAWGQQRAVHADSTPLEDLPDHARRANQLSGVGLGLGAASAGLTTLTWAVRW